VILLGQRHLRRTIAEFVAHYHRERNHQGIGNDFIHRSARRMAKDLFTAASGWVAC
jgi:hypothetical protein